MIGNTKRTENRTFLPSIFGHKQCAHAELPVVNPYHLLLLNKCQFCEYFTI